MLYEPDGFNELNDDVVFDFYGDDYGCGYLYGQGDDYGDGNGQGDGDYAGGGIGNGDICYRSYSFTTSDLLLRLAAVPLLKGAYHSERR
jgi:hypothetical protein